MSKGTLNKVMLIGRLGRNPELRYTQAGAAICLFSVATNETYKDKDGKQVDIADWHNCVAWHKLAEVCAQYLKKGMPVYIEGKMRTRLWDKDGVKHSLTEVIVERIEMIGNKTENRHNAEETEINSELGF